MEGKYEIRRLTCVQHEWNEDTYLAWGQLSSGSVVISARVTFIALSSSTPNKSKQGWLSGGVNLGREEENEDDDDDDDEDVIAFCLVILQSIRLTFISILVILTCKDLKELAELTFEIPDLRWPVRLFFLPLSIVFSFFSFVLLSGFFSFFLPFSPLTFFFERENPKISWPKSFCFAVLPFWRLSIDFNDYPSILTPIREVGIEKKRTQLVRQMKKHANNERRHQRSFIYVHVLVIIPRDGIRRNSTNR